MTSRSTSPTPAPAKRREKRERKCHLCSQVFFKAEHLSRHVRSHTKEKPFECDICHKIYARHDTLLRHSRSHSGARHDSISSSAHQPRARDESTESVDMSRKSGPVRHGGGLINGNPSQPAPTYPAMQQFSTSQSMEKQDTNPRFPSQFDPDILGADALMHAAGLSSQQPSLSPNASTQRYLASSNTLTNTLSNSQSSPHDTVSNAIQTSPMDIWDFGFDSQWPSWLAGEDFDLKAVNSSIAATMYQYTMPSPFAQQFEEHDPNTVIRPASRVGDSGDQIGPMDTMKKRWFTHMDEEKPEKAGHNTNGTVTPRQDTGQPNLDENYRVSLTKKLRHPVYDDSLPSTEFLNLCIRMYFARFNTIFPIIHGKSFRPSTENSLLLLSICSVGSLFVSSPSAIAHGTKIFEVLNKAILNSWENVMARSSAEAICMVQAAVIGQTFSMLSGNPRHLVLCESFHGTVIAWARQSQIFKERHIWYNIEEILGDSERVEKAWKSWVQSEHMIRITLGLHIQDAELAGIFHHEPLLRHGSTRLPVAASNRKFRAPTAHEWASIMLDEGQPEATTPRSPLFGLSHKDHAVSRFYAYTVLEGIGAAICESRQSGYLDSHSSDNFRDELLAWYNNFQKGRPAHESDSLCLMILWHSVFLTLYVDFDMLERAIGKDGSELAKEEVSSVTSWASSTDAKRCIVHASLIQKQLETMRVGTEPAIHVPLALFHAALTWYCYTTFAVDVDVQNSSKESLDFPEIKHLGINPTQHLFEASGFKFGRPSAAESSTLYLLTDMLQRIGHWEISRKYASILSSLIHAGSGFGMDMDYS